MPNNYDPKIGRISRAHSYTGKGTSIHRTFPFSFLIKKIRANDKTKEVSGEKDSSDSDSE